MVTYIFLAIAVFGLITWIRGSRKREYDLIDGGKFVMGVAVSLWVATSFVVGIGGEGNEAMSPYTCEVGLVAMNTSRNSEASGSFFLGTGSFDAKGYQTITFLKESGGGVQLDEVRAKDAVIYEDGGQTMTCERELVRQHKQDWMWPWAQETKFYGPIEYEFHVPEGSVVREFEVSP